MPRFSIILPCYNAAKALADTLDSLRAQTVTDWEAICVDDGSTDDTAQIIADYALLDDRIRRVAHDGKGPSAARNAGAKLHATGEIIAFCDADDLWMPEKLARLDTLFRAGAADAVFGRVAFFDGALSDAMRRSTVPADAVTIAMLLGENPVCTMSNIALTRGAFDATGGLNETLIHNEDLDWLIRLVGGGARLLGDTELHVLYRRNPEGLSADLDKMAAGREVALATAARYGVSPDARAEAIFARYLARRALRVDAGAATAFGFTLRGLSHSPSAFLFPLRRGAATAAAACAAPLMPAALRRALFTNS